MEYVKYAMQKNKLYVTYLSMHKQQTSMNNNITIITYNLILPMCWKQTKNVLGFNKCDIMKYENSV